MNPSITRLLLLCMSLMAIATTQPAQAAPELEYSIIAERTHKPTLFTQGLEIEQGFFYESSGLYGKSILVTYPIAEPAGTWAKLSAPFTKRYTLPTHYFAEGLTILGDKLYLLTWQEGTLLIFDKNKLTHINTLQYRGEGWGLTNNGKALIRSDGSNKLYFHSPTDFSILKTIPVREEQRPIHQLNELEFVDGYIWANIWHRDYIVKIDPATGAVVSKLNLSALRKKMNLTDSEQVLNGIAWDKDKNAFWVTGKNWPKMFLIQISQNKQ